MQRHSLICQQLNDIYAKKNQLYSNSFEQSIDEFGLVITCARLTDKLNRYKSLVLSGDMEEESMRDTLLDLANYAIMSIIYIDKNSDNNYYKFDHTSFLNTGTNTVDEDEELEFMRYIINKIKNTDNLFTIENKEDDDKGVVIGAFGAVNIGLEEDDIKDISTKKVGLFKCISSDTYEKIKESLLQNCYKSVTKSKNVTKKSVTKGKNKEKKESE